jgi:hypothetical protein
MTTRQKLILPLLVISILSLFLVVMQNWRKNPNKFSSWDCAAVTISEKEKGETFSFNLIDPTTDDMVTQLAGTTDLVCDPPTLFIWDVNEDGTEDLYFQHCGGHGYLYCDGQTVIYQTLRDGDVEFKNFWYRLHYTGSNRTITLVIFGSTSIALIIIVSSRKKRPKKEIP